jgi:hypothetical protein
LALDRVEGRSIDDGVVLAWIGDAFVGDFSDVNPIGEQLVQMPTAKGLTTGFAAARSSAPLGD